MNKKIFCIGGANIDCKFKAIDAITPGTSNPISSVTTFGGVARNVAENLAHWTNNIHLQCAVGSDSEGQLLLSHLHKLGVNIDDCLIMENVTTSRYYAVLTQDGELHVAYADMEIYNHIPCHSFSKSYNLWPDGSIIFIDTNLPTAIINDILGLDKQLKICIDPVSVSKANKIPHSLENVFLIKPNQAEAAALTGINIENVEDCIKAGHHLLQRGVQNVVISLGSGGYVIVNEKRQLYCPALKIDQIKDVNGAGDAFFAGILFGIQQNSTIIQACELGAAAAAFTLLSNKTVAPDITAACLQTFIQTRQENQHAAIF